MSSRHLSRSIVVQTLYELDFNEQMRDAEKVQLTYAKNLEDFGEGLEDKEYPKGLLLGVLSKKDDLDKIITACTPGWTIDKTTILDRNILRLGLYELLFGDKKAVPPKVAINEAIELAKNFSGDSAGRFVNGILGTVVKEMGLNTESQKEIKIDTLPKG
ncbi:MAG: transcription antitermination factor NusB, partial [Candidatus Parcubacteria bacterium]|nr:transcription antitermination factor NusB [Candidatus Parcubacteria bacterium]